MAASATGREIVPMSILSLVEERRVLSEVLHEVVNLVPLTWLNGAEPAVVRTGTPGKMSRRIGMQGAMPRGRESSTAGRMCADPPEPKMRRRLNETFTEPPKQT